MNTSLLPSPDNEPRNHEERGSDASPAQNDTTTGGAPAPRFRLGPRGGAVNGRSADIVVAVDGAQTNRISAHPMSSAELAAIAADLLNRADQQEGVTAASADDDQTASEAARAAVLDRIEKDFPPQIPPFAEPAESLHWRPGVASTRTAADDAVNTYIVERHTDRIWELCAWNNSTFDDVERLAGIKTPTRELARAIAAEYSALGEHYCADDHGGTSRASAAILAAYYHERVRHRVPPQQTTAA